MRAAATVLACVPTLQPTHIWPWSQIFASVSWRYGKEANHLADGGVFRGAAGGGGLHFVGAKRTAGADVSGQAVKFLAEVSGHVDSRHDWRSGGLYRNEPNQHWR